jgi:hypothetical protein
MLTAVAAIPLMIVMVFVLLVSGEPSSNPGSFLLTTIILLAIGALLVGAAFAGAINGVASPKYVLPSGMLIDQQSINIGLRDGGKLSFPWSSLRGVMAPSTDEYPHYYYYDSKVYDPNWGALVFDEYIIHVRTDAALNIQSIYSRKFGFYPQKYWFSPGTEYSSPHDDYPQLQKRPKLGWRT